MDDLDRRCAPRDYGYYVRCPSVREPLPDGKTVTQCLTCGKLGYE